MINDKFYLLAAPPDTRSRYLRPVSGKHERLTQNINPLRIEECCPFRPQVSGKFFLHFLIERGGKLVVAVGNPDHPCIKLPEIVKLAAGIEKQLSFQGQATAFDHLTDCRKGFLRTSFSSWNRRKMSLKSPA